jgi:dihydropyrimidinase
MANGVPGLEVRLPLLFSEGVGKGRITLNEFVALTATNHARIYGLSDRKGTVAVGVDADIAIWDAQRSVTLTASMMHDNVGYTPYEGRVVKGWPVTVVSRGRVVIEGGTLHAARGSGEFLPRGVPGPLSAVHKPERGAGILKSLLGLAAC